MLDLDVQRTSPWSLLLFAIFTFHLVLAGPGFEPANLGSLVYRSTALPSAQLQLRMARRIMKNTLKGL